ncbi:MAG: hypothetical protein FWE38_02910 [Firmicutes bacterium]|nr:hypothetical protein [Bacillota bacterium]
MKKSKPLYFSAQGGLGALALPPIVFGSFGDPKEQPPVKARLVFPARRPPYLWTVTLIVSSNHGPRVIAKHKVPEGVLINVNIVHGLMETPPNRKIKSKNPPQAYGFGSSEKTS